MSENILSDEKQRAVLESHSLESLVQKLAEMQAVRTVEEENPGLSKEEARGRIAQLIEENAWFIQMNLDPDVSSAKKTLAEMILNETYRPELIDRSRIIEKTPEVEGAVTLP